MVSLNMPSPISKDTAITLGMACTLAGAIWWAAVIDTRTRAIAPIQQDVTLMKQDIAVIKERLTVRQAAER